MEKEVVMDVSYPSMSDHHSTQKLGRKGSKKLEYKGLQKVEVLIILRG